MKKVKPTAVMPPTHLNTFQINGSDFFDWEPGTDFANRFESPAIYLEECIKQANGYRFQANVSELTEKYSVALFFNPVFWEKINEAQKQITGDNWGVLWKTMIKKLEREKKLEQFALSMPKSSSGMYHEDNHLKYSELFDALLGTPLLKKTLGALYQDKIHENENYSYNKIFYHNHSYTYKGISWTPPKKEEIKNYRAYDLDIERAYALALTNKTYEKKQLTLDEFERGYQQLSSLIQSTPQYKKIFFFDKNKSLEDLAQLTQKSFFVLGPFIRHLNMEQTGYSRVDMTHDKLLNLIIPSDYIDQHRDDILQSFVASEGMSSRHSDFLMNVARRVQPHEIENTTTKIVERLEAVYAQKYQAQSRLNAALKEPLPRITTEFSWTYSEKSSLNEFFSTWRSLYGKELTDKNYQQLHALSLKDKELFKAIHTHFKCDQLSALSCSAQVVLEIVDLLGHDCFEYLKKPHFNTLSEPQTVAFLQSGLNKGLMRLDFEHANDFMKDKKVWKQISFTWPNKSDKDAPKGAHMYDKIAKETGLFRDTEFVKKLVAEKNIPGVGVALGYKAIKQNADIMLSIFKQWPTLGESALKGETENKLFADKKACLALAELVPKMYAKAKPELWRDIDFVGQALTHYQKDESIVQYFPSYIETLASAFIKSQLPLEEVLKSFEDKQPKATTEPSSSLTGNSPTKPRR